MSGLLSPAITKVKDNTDLWLLLLLAGILLGAGLGLRDPWPADEPRFALIVRDMVASGNWLFPYRGGEIYPDKPPLFFWLMGAFLVLTDSLRVSFLLPSLLAGLGILALTFDLAKRLWDVKIAWHAGLLLLVTFQFILQSKYAQIDALLTFWTTLGIYSFVRYLLLNASTGWLFLGFSACGLGVITKGVGFLPLLIFIPYLYATHQKWLVTRTTSLATWLACIAVFLLPILLWLVPMWLTVDTSGDSALQAYRDNVLLRQTITRYGNPWGHLKPFWYYLSQIPVLWLPFSILLPWLIPNWYKHLKLRDPKQLLLLGFGVLVLIFFSISPGKRGLYIFPALPAFILAAAPIIPGLIKNIIINRLAFAIALIVNIVLLTAILYLGLGDASEISYVDSQSINMLVAAILIFCFVMFIGFIYIQPQRGIYALTVFLISFWLLLSFYIAPLADPYRSGRRFMETVEAEIVPSNELAIVNYREQHLLQATRPITHFGYHRNAEEEIKNAAAWLKEQPRRYLLVQEKLANSCFSKDQGKIIGHSSRSKWKLFNSNSETHCLKPQHRHEINYIGKS